MRKFIGQSEGIEQTPIQWRTFIRPNYYAAKQSGRVILSQVRHSLSRRRRQRFVIFIKLWSSTVAELNLYKRDAEPIIVKILFMVKKTYVTAYEVFIMQRLGSYKLRFVTKHFKCFTSHEFLTVRYNNCYFLSLSSNPYVFNAL